MDELVQAVVAAYIVELSQGNPGAITVLTQVFRQFPDEAAQVCQVLQHRNIMGSDLWVLFKQHNKDVATFVRNLCTDANAPG
jgi:hypothetical protein